MADGDRFHAGLSGQLVITCHANNREDNQGRGQARGLVQPLVRFDLTIR